MAANNNGDSIEAKPLPAPSKKKLRVACKHLNKMYKDFRFEYDEDSRTFATISKHCTLLEHGVSYETIVDGEAASSIPDPIDLILKSYYDCKSGDYRNICGKKYAKMLRELVDARN